jgi:hypothetical protein
MKTCGKYKQTYVYCGMLKRWIARNLMLGREHGQAFPQGELPQVPIQDSGTDSFYFYLRNSSGTALVSRLALRKNGFCEYWFGLNMPDLTPLVIEGTAALLPGIYLGVEGLSFVPQPSGSWQINVDFPAQKLHASLLFSPITPIFDFASLRDKNQIANALASMSWNSHSFKALKSMKTEHIEQAGRWKGELSWAGIQYALEGVGARDHSRGERNWHQWDSHSWFTGFNDRGQGFNLSLIHFKGLPTLRAGYISRPNQEAVCLVNGPDSPIASTSGSFDLAGLHDAHADRIDFKTLGLFPFTMDSVYRIEEGYGWFDWKGDRYFGILERGFKLNK